MPIHTVTIASNPYEVYGGLTAAGLYVAAMFGPAAEAWLALTTDKKGQTLRAATLYVDQQPWSGTATGLVGVDATTLQFPRSGLTRNGVDVDSTIVPPEVEQAAFELAVMIAADATLTSKADQGSNISSVSAGGGVGVTFFNPTSARSGAATVLPTVVHRLVAAFIASPGGSIEGGFGQGGNCESTFRSEADFDLGYG